MNSPSNKTVPDRGEICDRFLDSIEYDLYPFQEEALLAWFEVEGGLLVAAPTGMGKTLIAEAAVFEALHTRQRLYYTTPLIALSEQKFREFQDRAEVWGFSRDDVGLITGNRRENPNGLVRVVVAEILLNHLLEAGGGHAPLLTKEGVGGGSRTPLPLSWTSSITSTTSTAALSGSCRSCSCRATCV
jgi:superfamily II RNA helicase